MAAQDRPGDESDIVGKDTVIASSYANTNDTTKKHDTAMVSETRSTIDRVVDLAGDVPPEIVRLLEYSKLIESVHLASPVSMSDVHKILKEGPRDHQLAAVANIEAALKGDFELAVLADDLRTGKTLPAIIVAVRTILDRRSKQLPISPIVIVVPEGGLVSVMDLSDSATNPYTILKTDIVICNYGFLQREFQMIEDFKQAMSNYQPGTTPPKRPTVSLMSEIILSETAMTDRYPLIILDDFHAMNDMDSTTFASIKHLRSFFAGKIGLSGTPFDNGWSDVLKLLTLSDERAFRDLETMLALYSVVPGFSAATPPSPIGKYFNRLVQTVNCFVIRRPKSAIRTGSPGTERTKVAVDFDRGTQEKSDNYYNTYASIQKQIQAGIYKGSSDDALKSLIKAQQLSKHPELPRIAKMDRELQQYRARPKGSGSLPRKEYNRRFRWESFIAPKRQWQSPRVNEIIRLCKSYCKKSRSASILVLDNDPLFLRILKIALDMSSVLCVTFLLPDKGQYAENFKVHNDFQVARARKVLLATFDNAIGDRFDTQILIRCSNCKVDEAIVRTRDRRHEAVAALLKQAERVDGQLPTIFRNVNSFLIRDGEDGGKVT
ncbi:Hypothetical protein D9617_21g096450 [Elsinoe fawcettii]|nr:Hypothetical protein D9617_21g096450 [Elsinoe fawcettii]